MVLYAKQRRWGAALKQYRICRGVLQRELGIEPESETEQLYKKLLQTRHAPAIGASEIEPLQWQQPEEAESQPRASSEGGVAAEQFENIAPFTGEFRQATLLFTSLAGFSFPEAPLEPEKMHRLLSRYFSIVAEAV